MLLLKGADDVIEPCTNPGRKNSNTDAGSTGGGSRIDQSLAQFAHVRFRRVFHDEYE
jgi:hypothetical protein